MIAERLDEPYWKWTYSKFIGKKLWLARMSKSSTISNRSVLVEYTIDALENTKPEFWLVPKLMEGCRVSKKIILRRRPEGWEGYGSNVKDAMGQVGHYIAFWEKDDLARIEELVEQRARAGRV